MKKPQSYGKNVQADIMHSQGMVLKLFCESLWDTMYNTNKTTITTRTKDMQKQQNNWAVTSSKLSVYITNVMINKLRLI